MVGEWRKVKINEIAEISRGISWKSSEEFDSYQEGTIRVYKIPHIQPNSRFQLENNKVYIRKPSNYEKYLLEDNDILMVGSNGNPERVGNVVRYKKSENALFASFLLRLRAKEYIDHEFLYYRLLNPDIQNAITDESAGSTGLRNINALKMGELSFRLPPFNEQRKIAAILSSVDEAIEKTEAIIEQTEKVKKGLMQQLLTKGIGHTKFKKTEIGEIPEGWELKKVEEVFYEVRDTSNNLELYPLYSLTIEEGLVPKPDRYERSFLLKNKEENQYRLVYPQNILFNPMNLRFGAIAISKERVPVSVSAYYNVLSTVNDNYL